MKVRLVPVRPEDAPRFAHMLLGEGQEDFVTLPVDRLSRLGPDEDGWGIEIEDGAGGALAGFFVIDRAYPAAHPFARKDELGLRALAVDAARQGEGIGTAAMAALPGLMAAHYPEAAALVLTVNCRNAGARAVYLRAGWRDDGELYHGGRSGPQHVLRLMRAPDRQNGGGSR